MTRSPIALEPRARGSASDARLAAVLLAAVAITLFVIRLTGLPDLVDNEFRLGATVLNAIQGGNWIIPHDALGNTDKPPMLTWLSALASLAVGRVDRFTLYVPTAAATLALALLIFVTTRRHFGLRAGVFAGLAYLLSNVVAQQIATARWDGLFAFTVALVAFAAFRAWTTGRGWTLFWIAGAATTLTKGPLGIVLGSLGLLAAVWELRSGRWRPLAGSHVLGLAAFVVIVGGWFLAAYHARGARLVDDMIRSELVRHAVMHAPAHRFRKPPSDFLANFAPWSLVAVLGLWRVWSNPTADDDARRFERFCFCWFTGGLLLFALSPHNPARLLYPIIPPAAILAGRELDRLAGARAPRTVAALCTVVVVVALAAFTVKYHQLDRRRDHVRRTLALLALHDAVHERVGDEFPLTYVGDVPFALQLTFNTMRPAVTFEEAAALLRGDAPAFVVVCDLPRLRRTLAEGAPPIYEVAGSSLKDRPYVTIVSNRPRLEWSNPMSIGLGPLQLRSSGVHLGPTQDGEVVLRRRNNAATVTVSNAASSDPTLVRLRVAGPARRWRETRTLAGGESWFVKVP